MRTTLTLWTFAAVLLLATPALAASSGPSCATVGISGPSNVYAETGCVTATWSVTCSCPNGAHTKYLWKIDGDVVGTFSTMSQTYCPTSPAETFTIQIEAIAICGSVNYPKTQSAFISLCDNTGPFVICNG